MNIKRSQIQDDGETLKIPIGKGTIGYRILMVIGGAFLSYQGNNAIENQETIRTKLDRIEYQQTQYIKSIELVVLGIYTLYIIMNETMKYQRIPFQR